MSAREGVLRWQEWCCLWALGKGKGDWRWNDLEYGEQECVQFGMCVFDVYLDE